MIKELVRAGASWYDVAICRTRTPSLGGIDGVLSQSAMNFGHKRENVDS